MTGNGHRAPARDSGKSCKFKQVMFIIVLKEGHTVVFCTGLHTVAERDDVREDSFWMAGCTAVVYAQGQRGMNYFPPFQSTIMRRIVVSELGVMEHRPLILALR